jgi:copper chaperone
MASVVVKVSGMKCGGCVKSVTNVLQELPGVNRVEVLLEPGEARVDYDPGKVQVEAMRQVVADAGFEAA